MKKVKLLFVLTLIFTINIYGQEGDYIKPIDRSVQPKQGKTPTYTKHNRHESNRHET